ncbi:unnamed protein product [Prunus armeniaca]|uniref:Uncharacterized protein n=1 Tax=Prunus armeniaca TaxID=36596 RepID=A0A6J5W1Q7_PRUAR|nr:unnamed protein product [Prunus armeniaca]
MILFWQRIPRSPCPRFPFILMIPLSLPTPSLTRWPSPSSPDTAHTDPLDLESSHPSSPPTPPQLPSSSSPPPTDLLSPLPSISPASILTYTRNPTLAICTFPSPSTTPA